MSLPVELEAWAEDALYINTRINLTFRDRLRVLFGRTLELRTMTMTEAKPGRVSTWSAVTVGTFCTRWATRGKGAYAEAGPAPEEKR